MTTISHAASGTPHASTPLPLSTCCATNRSPLRPLDGRSEEKPPRPLPKLCPHCTATTIVRRRDTAAFEHRLRHRVQQAESLTKRGEERPPGPPSTPRTLYRHCTDTTYHAASSMLHMGTPPPLNTKCPRVRRGEASEAALAATVAETARPWSARGAERQPRPPSPPLKPSYPFCMNATARIPPMRRAAHSTRDRRPLERLLRHRVQHTEPFDRARRGEAAEAALAAAEAVPPAHEYCRPHGEQE
jgi:hypothetical protein